MKIFARCFSIAARWSRPGIEAYLPVWRQGRVDHLNRVAHAANQIVGSTVGHPDGWRLAPAVYMANALSDVVLQFRKKRAAPNARIVGPIDNLDAVECADR